MRVPIEQRLGGEDLTVLAEAALRYLFVDPGLLNGVKLAIGREPLERRDGAPDRRDAGDARSCGRAVHEHGAGSALAEPASEARAVQVEIVAQNVEQRRGGIDIDG